ncbi:MAG: hypothetical protein LUH82_01885 [Clostridiales bacterium]|nr:hypothetical protein [Clostridiales bacterium]
MEKLRIERKGLYEIEVNDKGETIVFDTRDIELPYRANEAFKRIQSIVEKSRAKIQLIEKEQAKEDGFLTSKETKMLELTQKTFQQMREAMDGFLGNGACQKIFGDTNYAEMFDDLQEALQPHFEKMGILNQNLEEKIADKYGDGGEDTLE